MTVSPPPTVRGRFPSGPAHVATTSQMRRWLGRVKCTFKALVNLIGLCLTALPAATCKLERWCWLREDVFVFWSQAFALIPGLPGSYLRKCFYHQTLAECALDCEIGFLTTFTQRRTRIGSRVYIGSRASLGAVTLRAGALIGSRASIINGGKQHSFDANGRLTPCDPRTLQQIEIGEETWVGEAAVLLANVGSRCIVAAGSVVSNPLPDRCIVGGNPARFISRVVIESEGNQP